MTMGWSRPCYMEMVRRADAAVFIQCHVNAFEFLYGIPCLCLYDKAKVVILRWDEEKHSHWNPGFFQSPREAVGGEPVEPSADSEHPSFDRLRTNGPSYPTDFEKALSGTGGYWTSPSGWV